MPLKKIVYVDDDSDDRDLYHEAHTYISDSELVILPDTGALDAYLDSEPHHPSLIVMDINMPGERGVQAAIRLMESPAYQHIPIVIFSTTISPTDSKTMSEKGIPFITKPGTFQELCETIQRFIGKAGHAPACEAGRTV